MTLQEAIQARHSVRAYKNEPLADETVSTPIITTRHKNILFIYILYLISQNIFLSTQNLLSHAGNVSA